MENHFGGNSSNGENKFSKFPLGAHYLPIPNKADEELKNFLKESKIYLKDDENGEPIFDEYQVTYAPEERLFIKMNGKKIYSAICNFGESKIRISTIFSIDG
jgi:hypothetical protein